MKRFATFDVSFSECKDFLLALAELRQEVKDLQDARQKAGDTNATLTQSVRGLEAEIRRLQSTESAVCQLVFGPEATHSRLSEIPEHVERWISDGVFAGASATMAHASSLYRGLDLEAISEGFAADRTSEIEVIENEVRPYAAKIRDSVDPQVVMGLKELPPDEEEKEEENQVDP
jgi:hypothetical protein